ncbi:hypothetical protein SJAG_00273, partial [Schizosaccharomyces japonicus yFS275]
AETYLLGFPNKRSAVLMEDVAKEVNTAGATSVQVLREIGVIIVEASEQFLQTLEDIRKEESSMISEDNEPLFTIEIDKPVSIYGDKKSSVEFTSPVSASASASFIGTP